MKRQIITAEELHKAFYTKTVELKADEYIDIINAEWTKEKTAKETMHYFNNAKVLLNYDSRFEGWDILGLMVRQPYLVGFLNGVEEVYTRNNEKCRLLIPEYYKTLDE